MKIRTYTRKFVLFFNYCISKLLDEEPAAPEKPPVNEQHEQTPIRRGPTQKPPVRYENYFCHLYYTLNFDYISYRKYTK